MVYAFLFSTKQEQHMATTIDSLFGVQEQALMYRAKRA
jgi:hypothetical protein